MTDPSRPLSILYRGRLSSCNYDCGYCPFAKTRDTRASLQRDAADLGRFVDWVAGAVDTPISVLFTPWGEALVRRHYREAMLRMSHLPHVRRVVAQTNLCFGMHWLDDVDRSRFALWCTYHPGQVTRSAFVARCWRLRELGIRFSVGMVALDAHLDEIERLREELPADVFFWLNAYDERGPDYYTATAIDRLQSIDPWFGWNLSPAPSLGAPCDAGEHTVSVDGDGNVQRCHFVKQPLGNLYDGSFRAQLRPRTCPNTVCDCFIGYVHRQDLPFATDFAEGRLERIPARLHAAG